MKRLLITGAAGQIGAVCRERLAHVAETLRISDIVDLGNAAAHEEIVICDLTDKAAVQDLAAGCNAIVHMGGQRTEATWDVVRSANMDAVFNLYEAARKNGVDRIFFASSNHAIGFYHPSERLDASNLTRPDGLYGVSKVFGEAIASMYFDKYGIESALVRIGSCFPEPRNTRMLSTWLSFDDLIRLIECVFRVPVLGCPVIYGVSNNDAAWWDNSAVQYLGWQPQDNAEHYRDRFSTQTALTPEDQFQGAGAATIDIIED